MSNKHNDKIIDSNNIDIHHYLESHLDMKNSKTITLTANPSQKLSIQIGATVLLLIASVLLPFLVHLIPSQGPVPIGAQILPIFIAPLIAVVFFRFHVAFIIAAISPLLNAVLFGQPDLFFTLRLTAELIVFVSLVFYLKDWVGLRWVNAPVSLIMSKLFVALGIGILPVGFGFSQVVAQFTGAVSAGAIGIFILWVINILLVSYQVRQNK